MLSNKLFHRAVLVWCFAGLLCAQEPAADPRAAAQPKTEVSVEASRCQLTINLVDDFSQESVAGLVRVTHLDSGQAIEVPGYFRRARQWYAVPGKVTVRVPRARLRIEAIQGLETELAVSEVDTTSRTAAAVQLPMRKFYETRFREWYAGNTHLHLMRMSRADAERYLQVVPRADNLDLVFLSCVRRVLDEQDHGSNQIVQESFSSDILTRLSEGGTLIARGQEHRHNFGRGGQGYGHALMLNLRQPIQPVSRGPGLMAEGTDGQPLQRGLTAAREQGATVIWAHSDFGHEDIPSWINGLVDAQNIFDISRDGDFERIFYRYLNLGLRVPFSTGTNWTIYDFARVYVPVPGELTTAGWLENLRAGRSYITNGPFLEMETERAGIGGTLTLESPNVVTVVGQGMGRRDFGGLELVYNGRVVHRVGAEAEGGYYFADLRHGLFIDQPGWFALRIPSDVGQNELGRNLFAHTSPIYVEMQGRRIFRTDVAGELVSEMQRSVQAIQRQARFGSDAERQAVLGVYRRAIEALELGMRQTDARP
jgi:hypothetical protein